MGVVQALQKVLIDGIDGCLLFGHRCSHSIVGGQSVSQARSALGEAVRAVSDRLLVPLFLAHLLGDLPRPRGEAHRPVAPRVFLPAFFKTGSDVSLFAVTGDFA